MPKYKVGDILKSKQSNHAPLEVLAVIDRLFGLRNQTQDNILWEEETYLDRNGYTLAQPARWVPEYGQRYEFIGSGGDTFIDGWEGTEADRFRLSIGNVFQVGGHAGIEALKRKWQEGNNTFNS